MDKTEITDRTASRCTANNVNADKWQEYRLASGNYYHGAKPEQNCGTVGGIVPNLRIVEAAPRGYASQSRSAKFCDLEAEAQRMVNTLDIGTSGQAVLRTTSDNRDPISPRQTTQASSERQLDANRAWHANGTESAQKDGFRNPFDLRNFWVHQSHNYDCGPTSLAMAISDIRHLPKFTVEQINQISKETGTKQGGFPFGADGKNMEHAANNHGLSAQTFRFQYNDAQIMTQLDAELARGHRAIALGPSPSLGQPNAHGGHFIYISGKVDDNHYLIANPANSTFGPDGGSYRRQHERPMTGREDGKRVVSRTVLEAWLRGRTSRGDAEFTAVW